MKRIKAVIGANFGDEGKGLMTDYLSSQCKDGIVVRFNGGAQAGHTVTTPECLRHVFGHVGSGTFTGMPTYLSRFFVVNPMLYMKEMATLKGLGVTPEVYMDKACMVTSPYDIMLNQIAEISRGSQKHGSCGVGFNETITRCLYAEDYAIHVSDLADEQLLQEKLHAIRDAYIPLRLKALGIHAVPERYETLLRVDGIIKAFMADARFMLKSAAVSDLNILSPYEVVLFEGAQGLLLDQDHPYFPHVTRSNTGMKNVAELLAEMGCDGEDTEVVYATRAYMTRHGAGPFPTELPEKPYPRIEDRTNVPNPYQDALRYGLIDLNALADAISKDLGHTGKLMQCRVKLAITCLDQLEEKIDYIYGGEKRLGTIDAFIGSTFEALSLNEGYLSYGPTRATVKAVSI